jgi:hypothetical protein
MKKITFTDKRPDAPAGGIDDWVHDRHPAKSEPTKRLTIDVSMSLHGRIKSQCAMKNLVMADAIRELLDRGFPAESGQGVGEGMAS